MTSERIPYTQAGRMMAISTPLGADVLLLEHLEIDERVNHLFEISAQVKSQRDDLEAGDLVGTTVDFSLHLRDGSTRYWNGLVTHMHEGPLTTRTTRSYAMTVRPKLWLMTQRSDCRIFLDQTSPQIVETLCQEHGIVDLELRVTGQPSPQAYSVQWNETDLHYLLRRIEEDGLFYWFEHQQGRHTLVVADHMSGYRDASPKDVRFTLGSADQDHITEWRRTFAFTPGKRAGRDWNFETMTSPAATQSTFANVPGNAQKELYEYPGRFMDTTNAERMMKNRIQASETDFERVAAVSTVRTLAPGQQFTPQDTAKPTNTFDPQVVTSISHVLDDPTYETGRGQPTYTNTFRVMPASTPATPHRTIPRPRIVGSQIAMIAGPDGEEIHTDQYGRVKLWFPWDRRARKDGSDTIWVRVGQPWAGGTWGHQVIPRVGMEAVISYQDGDPDRPLITALVPDPTNPTPYPLPANKTRMTFRSNSYKSKGFNELTFEDATGAENLFVHAQKDHTTKIENNQTNSVGANQSQVVGQHQALTVGGNQTMEIGGSFNTTIGATGAGTAALMAPFAGMVGNTTAMLTQALAAAATGTGNTSGDPSTNLVAGATAMVPPLAGSLIGLLGQSGQQAQQNVWNGPSPRPDAGTALAGAGNLFGQAAGGLFNLPGMHNHITGTMRTDHCGCVRVEQVGTTKITHVGSTFATRVGKSWSMTIGQDAISKVGHDWTADVHHRFSVTAGENVMLHAAQAVGIIADDSIYIAANDDITQTAKTINVYATDSIALNVGENSITISNDGTISIDAVKSIALSAGEKIVLKGGGSSLSIGPSKVESQPMVVEGSSDIAAIVGIGVKNIAKDQFKLPGIVADLLGYAAMKVSKLPFVGRMEQGVADYFSPEAVEQRNEDPMNAALRE